MILVVDTNRIIAALIKDSTSRKIILSGKLELVSLNFGQKEIKKYEEEIMKKAKITEQEFDKVFELLLKRIIILDDLLLANHMTQAKEIMDKIDPDDTPFIAAALAMKCAIWSDDEHFQKQNKIKTWKTKDLAMLQ